MRQAGCDRCFSATCRCPGGDCFMEILEWNWKSRDNLVMYAQVWQPPGAVKAVVCLVHGLGEHIGRYPHVGAALSEKGFALAGFDLRGHGKSQGRRGHAPSLNVYFDDIDFFLEQVAERFHGSPCFLYGHSLGAILTLAYVPLRKPRISGVIV